jgi:hypothetical protein
MMDKIIAIRLFMWSSVLVFSIVPVIISIMGFSSLIYGGVEEIDRSLLIYNALIIIFAIKLSSWIFYRKKSLRVNLFRGDNKKLIHFMAPILIVWCVVFISSGGFEYRILDVEQGLESRGYLLQLCFQLIGVMNIISIYLFLYRRVHTGLQFNYINFSLLCYLLTLMFSGSRGYFIFLLIAFLILKVLRGDYFNKSIIRIKHAPVASIFLSGLSTLVKLLIVAIFATLALALWGMLRDNAGDFIFSLLHRASEPYWYFSYEVWLNNGEGFEIYFDTVKRVLSIVTRDFIWDIDGSIDGADYYMKNYLGIETNEGVSLPITLMGHGFLANGYLGVFLNFFVAGSFLITMHQLITKLSFLPKGLVLSILSYQTSKAIYIFPKSLSGVFLYLGYELIRDVIFILLLVVIYKYVKR